MPAAAPQLYCCIICGLLHVSRQQLRARQEQQRQQQLQQRAQSRSGPSSIASAGAGAGAGAGISSTNGVVVTDAPSVSTAGSAIVQPPTGLDNSSSGSSIGGARSTSADGGAQQQR